MSLVIYQFITASAIVSCMSLKGLLLGVIAKMFYLLLYSIALRTLLHLPIKLSFPTVLESRQY